MMTITGKLSFGITFLMVIILCFLTQGRIGSKSDVRNFLNKAPGQIKTFIETSFPEDLIIKIDKGRVTINQALPYCFFLDKNKSYGVVFDDSVNPNINSFKVRPDNFPCNPIAIVGPNYVVAQDNKELRVWRVPQNMTTNVDRETINKNVEKYAPLLQSGGMRLYSLFPAIMAIFLLPVMMLMNYWYSFILALFIKLFNLSNHPESKNKYWISLFFSSILFGITAIISMFTDWKLTFPLSTTILVTAAGIIYLKSKETSQRDSGRNLKHPSK